jgi:hypothetical protein
MLPLQFLQKHWYSLLLLIVAPTAAFVAAWYLVWHTNWMTYDAMNVRLWPASDSGGDGDFVLHGLLFCSLALVFFNTLAYGSDAWTEREPVVMSLYGLSLLIICIWGTEVYGGWLTRWLNTRSPDWSRHVHDLFAGSVFAVFAVMDFLLYTQARRIRLKGDVDAIPHVQEETFLLQLLMVDMPVIAGILVVNVFLHELLEQSPALGHGVGAMGFLAGLGSGALLMQLALSQFVFLMIYARYFKWEYKTLTLATTGAPAPHVM